MPRPTKYELVDKIYRYALAELVVAVAGQKPPCGWHHRRTYQTGRTQFNGGLPSRASGLQRRLCGRW